MKKLINIFFDDVEEEFDETKESVIFKSEETTKVQPVVTKPVHETAVTKPVSRPADLSAVVRSDVPKEEVKGEKREPNFRRNERQSEATNMVKIDEVENATRPVVENVKVRNEKYVFHPPLSPIFGIVGEEVKETVKTYTNNTERQPSKLGTIISPIYGKEELEEGLENVDNFEYKEQYASTIDEASLEQTLDDVLVNNYEESERFQEVVLDEEEVYEDELYEETPTLFDEDL